MILRKGKTQITFVFQPDQPVKTVAVVGSFNTWDAAQGKMTKQKDGSFRKRLVLDPGEHRYRFIADGQWITDPAGDGHVPNDFGTVDSLVCIGD